MWAIGINALENDKKIFVSMLVYLFKGGKIGYFNQILTYSTMVLAQKWDYKKKQHLNYNYQPILSHSNSF